MSKVIDLSLIVPVLNEEDAVPLFLQTIRPVLAGLGLVCEIVFVDDGSTDRTAEIIRDAARTDDAIRLVRLSRNFGKEAALTAGLDVVQGRAAIPMDVDLQDPPELIADFVRLWREGYDVVYGQRVARDADSSAKRASAGMFYRVFNKLSAQKIEPNVGDYRLMSRPVIDATLLLRERNRFMKGLFAWVGFRAVAVPYSRPLRAAGTTKFNYWKLWNFALDGVTSFSTIPLRIWTYVGGIVACVAFLFTLVVLIQTLAFGRDVPGYASLMIVVLVLGAVQILSLGIIGEYLGRLYLEAKQRPIYLVRETAGYGATPPLGPGLPKAGLPQEQSPQALNAQAGLARARPPEAFAPQSDHSNSGHWDPGHSDPGESDPGESAALNGHAARLAGAAPSGMPSGALLDALSDIPLPAAQTPAFALPPEGPAAAAVLLTAPHDPADR